MTEAITIVYNPIVNSNISHSKNLTVNIDQLLGLMIMSSALTSPDNISIKLFDGNIADITQIATISYFGYNPNIYDYTAKFLNYDVSFNGMELIQGGIQLCLLLGVDPSSVITDIKNHGQPIKVDFGRYLRILSVPNFTKYDNGTSVLVTDMEPIVSNLLVDSLSRSLRQCFPEFPPGIMIPSELYMITLDEYASNVIASCAATLYPPESIKQFKVPPNILVNRNTSSNERSPIVWPGSYYIFNVCSNIEYRGQGLSKAVMISMLNDLIGKGNKLFTLEVAPDNKIAHSLYQSLGFKKIGVSRDNNHTYDVLFLGVV